MVREDCDGKPLYCTDPVACNYNEVGECIYHGSREDCDGKPLYCTDPEACNYNEMGECTYHGSREDCDGKPLYCTDPVACNYNEVGECVYHGSREDCYGDPIYCDDDDACNTGSMNVCQFPPDGLDCEGNCDNSAATNYGQPSKSCDFTINTIEEYFASQGDYLEISESDGTTTYKLKKDFVFNETNTSIWYNCNSILNNVVFDGENYTITYTGSDPWEGLFYVVSGTDTNKMTFTVQNINFKLNKAGIADYCGGIIRGQGKNDEEYFENYTDITIDNCHISSDNSEVVIGEKSGGIVGLGFCNGTDEVGTITNCSNKVPISTQQAGGICGRIVANTTIAYCWNEGVILGEFHRWYMWSSSR